MKAKASLFLAFELKRFLNDGELQRMKLDMAASCRFLLPDKNQKKAIMDCKDLVKQRSKDWHS